MNYNAYLYHSNYIEFPKSKTWLLHRDHKSSSLRNPTRRREVGFYFYFFFFFFFLPFSLTLQQSTTGLVVVQMKCISISLFFTKKKLRGGERIIFFSLVFHVDVQLQLLLRAEGVVRVVQKIESSHHLQIRVCVCVCTMSKSSYIYILYNNI